MFIDTIPNRKSPPAVLLRESYREGGKVKKRTLANLSKLPQALIEGIGALIAGGKVAAPEAGRQEEHGFEIVRSLPHGHVAAVRGMMRKLGLGRTLQGRTQVERRVRDLIEAMIIQRIIAPGSKLAFHRALAPETATSSLALSVGLTQVAEREVYAALDWLIEQQPRIEAALAKKHLVDGTLVLYDVSSSYMEGRCCPLAKYGYSRDHRSDRLQIVYGLLCAMDGTPVAVEVFEGDTSDPQTLREQVDKLRWRFKLSHVALVGDRGMITSARIAQELTPAGLDWISCLRAPQIAALAGEQGPLQMSLFDERDLAEITSPEFPGERLIACRNPTLAAERGRKRLALLESTERQLVRIAAAVARKPAKHDAATIGLAVGAAIDKHKVKKHFALDIADGRFAFRRREDEIAAEARLDGIYVVRTSLAADKLASEQAVAAYKSLALIERAFRTLKGVDMQVRPVHHWLSRRVRAHVFLCMLAYYVEHHMRLALAPLLFADHEPNKRERPSIVRPAEPSEAAKSKIARRQSVDGTPIMAWHDLIANLGTLTINEVELPTAERRTFHMLSRPTALQQQLFALLDVPTPSGVQ
jgi:Transposase DDE domain